MAQADKRRSLGRGLSALIPPKPDAAHGSSNGAANGVATGSSGRGLARLPLDQILPSDAQPRQVFDEAGLDELAASIREHGILQPIVVRARGGQYEIVAGERRWRAARRAGLQEVEALIMDVAEKDTLTLALVENVQRRDLNPMEEAEAYQRLHKELGYSQADIARAVGKERSTVANALRLLKLPQSVRELVLDETLSMGHARALLSIDTSGGAETLEKMAREVAAKGWSVRETERAVAAKLNRAADAKGEAAQGSKAAAGKPAETDAEREVRMRLQRAFGTRVELQHKAGKGTITVHFASFDELDGILARAQA